MEVDGVRGWVSCKVLGEPDDAPASSPASSSPSAKVQVTLHYREGDAAHLHHSLKLTVPPRWLAEAAPLKRLLSAFADNYSKKHPGRALDAATHRLAGRDGAVIAADAVLTRDLAPHLYVVPQTAAAPPSSPPAAPSSESEGDALLDIPSRPPQPPARRAKKALALDADSNNCYDLDDADDADGGDVVDPDEARKADQRATAFKDDGNKELAAKRYRRAVEKYDSGLALAPPPVGRLAAVLLANRAQALLSRVADGGLKRAAVFAALRDAASNSLEARDADEKYDKAWYRLGLANLELVKRCAGGGLDAPTHGEVFDRLSSAVRSLTRAAKLSPKVKAMRDAHKEAKGALEAHETALRKAALPPCYAGTPPVVASVTDGGDPEEWIHARRATTIPVERKRSGTVEAVVELPVLLKKQRNRPAPARFSSSLRVAAPGAATSPRVAPRVRRVVAGPPRRRFAASSRDRRGGSAVSPRRHRDVSSSRRRRRREACSPAERRRSAQATTRASSRSPSPCRTTSAPRRSRRARRTSGRPGPSARGCTRAKSGSRDFCRCPTGRARSGRRRRATSSCCTRRRSTRGS